MGLLNLLISDPATFILIAIPLLYSIILHELAHGWVASKMGDPTAKMMGRLTLNPLKHLDPIGTLMLFLVGFGWARPVPVDLRNIRNYRQGLILVSSAGIFANMAIAFVAILLSQILQPESSSVTAKALYYTAQINIMLAAFNLIPVPPLDGSKILMGFVSERMQYALSKLEPYGFFIIIGLLFFGALDPVIRVFRSIITFLIGMMLP